MRHLGLTSGKHFYAKMGTFRTIRYPAFNTSMIIFPHTQADHVREIYTVSFKTRKSFPSLPLIQFRILRFQIGRLQPQNKSGAFNKRRRFRARFWLLPGCNVVKGDVPDTSYKRQRGSHTFLYAGNTYDASTDCA